MSKLAVVLFNLGGPDRPEAVEPFLFNLFNDPAIIGAPFFVRRLLARRISRRRAPVAQEIYAQLGGRSPLLANTQAQARSLDMHLRVRGHSAKVFIAMRYWHPFAEEAAEEVATYAPDRIVLLPLYPQYSTTTTGSSLKSWEKAAAQVGLHAETRAVCCYPAERGFVLALADSIRDTLERWAGPPPRLLFSAHGLPKRIVRRGDPYQWQVERTAAAVAEALGGGIDDWVVCYQSRVGPLEWIGPFTDEEIRRAGREKKPVVVVPIAFVSEHSETLVELDVEYRRLAEESGVVAYLRVPTVGAHATFVEGLADLVETALDRGTPIGPDGSTRLCPSGFTLCVMAK